jgi:uncharacterized protein YlzI (FlbEa/FlbD family)
MSLDQEIIDSLSISKEKILSIQRLIGELSFELRKGKKYVLLSSLAEYMHVERLKRYLRAIGMGKELSVIKLSNGKKVFRLDAVIWTLNTLLSIFKSPIIFPHRQED